MASEFFVRSNVVFGKDAVKELPKILEEYHAKNVMVVYDAGVKMAGISTKVLEEVEKANVKVTIFDGVIPNPTNEVVEEAAEIARKENIDVFVAVGGGSSIDLTKAVNILMTNPGPIGQYGGIGLVKEAVLPLIAIPTTAGTSSEITNVVALTDTKAVCKYVKSTHNRRERPVCGHRGRSRGPFYYRITTFGKGPWDARDPHKTTFMALKHVIRLSIWQRQKETPGVEKAPGVSSPQRKESGRSGRDDGELRFGYDPAIHARRLRVYHRPRRLRMASRISIFFAARRFEPLNSMG